MSTGENEPGGIHARHIEADNVVFGVQIQGGDAQTASFLIQLAPLAAALWQVAQHLFGG